ncbi:MAG: DNA polymerase III subunit delta [Alphaproteobacteria bacterium]|nr:DNA polymerase III subunit delta [Alphaproteobacteria bacterium]
MKVSAREANGFIRKPPSNVLAVLVYGPDGGLVRERGRALVRSVLGDNDDPFRFLELDSGKISDDPARIIDESASMSLTGDSRVVLVRQADEGVVNAFEPILDLDRSEAFFVVEAGDLGPRSSLRKAFEGAKSGAAIPCYVDDAEAVTGLIRQTVKEAGLKIDPAAVDDLIVRLGSDRLITRGEIQKLVLFKGADGGTITADDVEQSVGDVGAVSMDEVAMATASGNVARLDDALQRAYREGVATVAVVRAVGRHLQRLMLAAADHQKGMPAKAAMAKLRPPVFFKQQNEFSAQLQRWTPATLGRALQIVMEAELDCKTTGLPDAALLERALIRIAAAARASA